MTLHRNGRVGYRSRGDIYRLVPDGETPLNDPGSSGPIGAGNVNFGKALEKRKTAGAMQKEGGMERGRV